MLGDTIAAEIGDITRFPTPGKLVGYTEAVPDGAPVRLLGPPRVPDQEWPQVPAWALIEAATHAARHPAYRNRYQTTKTRLGRQRGAKVARVDIARKLADGIWHMLTRTKPFALAGAPLRSLAA